MGPKAKRIPDRVQGLGQQARRQVHQSSQNQVVPSQSSLSVTFQQKILDVFVGAFSQSIQAHDIKSIMQEVKGHLFNRDFAAAFGKPEYLDVYALRWSAARALAYADLFTRADRRAWLESFVTQQSRSLAPISQKASAKPTALTTPSRTSDVSNTTAEEHLVTTDVFDRSLTVVTIGGGAGAEIVALAAALQHLNLSNPLHVLAIDAADWALPVRKLERALTTPPPLSAHASQAIKDANTSFINPGQMSIKFLHKDILDFDLTPSDAIPSHVENPNCTSEHSSSEMQDESMPSVFSGASLVTIMFTLNELFSASLQKTTALLLSLTDSMPSRSRLVVVDSPGSYSEIKLGKSGEIKRYPMKWLLDHTLLDVAGKGTWSKVEEDDSVWFRLERRGTGLQYPVDLENCRYQIHVYCKQ